MDERGDDMLVLIAALAGDVTVTNVCATIAAIIGVAKLALDTAEVAGRVKNQINEGKKTCDS